MICQQVIRAIGSDYAQNVNQVMSCGGDLFNLAEPNEPLVPANEPTPAWLLGLFAALGSLAVVMIVLFAVFYSRRNEANDKRNDKRNDREAKLVTATVSVST
jgi:hypothetical protein